VILWGTVVGVLPIVLVRAAVDFTGFRPSFWLDTGLVLVLFLYPLSFAYAVAVSYTHLDVYKRQNPLAGVCGGLGSGQRARI